MVVFMACEPVPIAPETPQAPSSPVEEPVAQEKPEPEPAEPEPADSEPADSEPVEVEPRVASWRNFPLWERVALPNGAKVPVPVGQELIDAAVHPTGAWTLVLTRDVDRDNVQWHRWTYAGPLESIPGPDLGEALASEIAWDPLDGAVYVLRSLGGVAGIARCDNAVNGACYDIMEVDGFLSMLRAPMARWDSKGRAFATLTEGGGRRVVTVRSDGSRAYDLTHPSGKMSELTAEVLRARAGAEQWDDQPPRVTRVSNAALVGIDPALGSAWLSTDDGLRRLDWEPDAHNWVEQLSPASGTSADPHQVRLSRNGRFRVEATDTALRLVDRDGTQRASTPIASGAQLLDLGATGRCALLRTTDGSLATACFEGRAARIRHLDGVPLASAPDLLQHGLAYELPAAERLYEVNEPLAYSEDNVGVFASVDGMLVLLHAGMQAVFLDGERTRSAPALNVFLRAVEAAGVDENTVSVARVGLHILSDGLSTPSEDATVEAELVRIRAGGGAESPLYEGEIDYSDHRPRGPYLGDPELEKLFVASQAVVLLKLSEDARTTLAQRPEVMTAWSAWVGAQAPFIMGTRQPLAFAEGSQPSWVEKGCLPIHQSLRLYPLAWGPDSEVIDRLTAHDDRPVECGVQRRPTPSGLDLFAALGGATAESILLTSPEGRYPELPERLAEVKRRPLQAPGLTGAWLDVVAAIARSGGGLGNVDSAVWQRRLIETGLSSWVDMRYLHVRVTERGSAQAGAGAGGEGVFEQLAVEPAHSAVDPLPEVWDALGVAFEKLAARTEHGDMRATSERLTTLAATNRLFAEMARQQMGGEALSSKDYEGIYGYVRDIERPLLKLLAGSPKRLGRTLTPSLDSKIVGIHLASPHDGPRQLFHIAKGKPRPVTVLLEERGVAVPVQGAVGSYYEVVDGGLVDDPAWLQRLPTTPRPHWLNPDPDR